VAIARDPRPTRPSGRERRRPHGEVAGKSGKLDESSRSTLLSPAVAGVHEFDPRALPRPQPQLRELGVPSSDTPAADDGVVQPGLAVADEFGAGGPMALAPQVELERRADPLVSPRYPGGVASR